MTENEYRKMIFAKAGETKTKADLLLLIDDIVKFQHDYGTIVIGCAAAAKAAFNVVNNSSSGGITGFQAGCIGWELVREFMSIEGPARLQDFDKMLYPQYSDKFQKTISKSTWEHLKAKAEENLKTAPTAHENVVAHWKSIHDGVVPFGFNVVDD